MISARKTQLAIVLMLACVFFSARGGEPNEAKTELEFETSNEEKRWARDHKHRDGRGPIRPKYVAEFFRQDDYPMGSGGLDAAKVLKTRAGRSISARQRQFLAVSDALVNMGFGRTLLNHRHFRVYAVSQEDAKRVTEVLLEIWTDEAKAKMQKAEDRFREEEQKMAEARKELPKKEAELERVTSELEKLRAGRRPLSTDGDAAEEARATVLEMDKILDALHIEVTGIKARLAAIEQYKSQKQGTSMPEVAKLEVMLAEQTVELAGALAKMEAARAIRGRHQEFYDLATRRATLESEVSTLRSGLGRWPARRREWEERLADPPAFWLPPEVYENKVTIYPVHPVHVD